MLLFILGEIGQWLGALTGIGGVVLEIVTGADYGYVAITASAVLWGLATKCKYYSKEHLLGMRRGKNPYNPGPWGGKR